MATSINMGGDHRLFHGDAFFFGPHHGYVRTARGLFTVFDAVAGGVYNGTVKHQPGGTVAGTYTDGNFVEHGFVRDPQGRLHCSIPREVLQRGYTVSMPQAPSQESLRTQALQAMALYVHRRERSRYSISPAGTALELLASMISVSRPDHQLLISIGAATGFLRIPEGP